MARSRVELTPGYVLHARPYRDSSLLIEAFTAVHGRMGLVARSARGPRSRLKALLQPLQPLLLSWQGAGDLMTLTAAEAQGLSVGLAGEPLLAAWYVNELLLKLTPRGEPHPILFADYSALLPQLPDDLDTRLRRFECRLLAELGYALQWPDPVGDGQHYRHDPELGFLPVAAEAADTIRGDSLIALRDGVLVEPRQRREARQLLRAALQRQLGSRTLETPRLLREFRQMQSGGSP